MDILEQAAAVLEVGRQYTLDEMKEIWWDNHIAPRDVFPGVFRSGLLTKSAGYDESGKFVVKYERKVS